MPPPTVPIAARYRSLGVCALLASALMVACGEGGGGSFGISATTPTTPIVPVIPPAAPAERTFTFESGPVRPLALSPDGARLFVANTGAGTLDILNVTDTGVTLAGAVDVDLDPVAVAVRTAGEVWVVNHLSDSISVVDVASTPARVVRTLLVGDEPRDIVFAGTARQRAFITTAHRGQQRGDPALAAVPGAGDPELTAVGGAATSDDALRALARQPGQPLTFTCLPPGWAPRL